MATEASHLNTLLTSKTFPIHIRTVEVGDAPLHASLISDPANGGDPDKPLAAATSETIIAKQRVDAAVPTVLGADGRAASGPGRVNMVVCTTDGQIIGLGGYGAIKDWERDGRKIRAGDVGVLLDSQFRGKGYGLEALKLAIDWGFSPVSEGGPQMDLVTLTTLEDNAPMVRIAEEKLGLKGKGVLRPAEFEADKNEWFWEMTAEDWKRQ